MKKNRELTLDEIRENMIGSSLLKPSEIVDLILAKNKKQLIKKIKMYGKKYSEERNTIK